MPHTILIVEDNPSLSFLLDTSLQAKGHRILTAANGLEGLSRLEQADIDLVISDTTMPEMSSHEFFNAVAAQKGLQRPPFIFLTTNIDASDVVNDLLPGVDDYLSKPISLRALMEKADSALRRLAFRESRNVSDFVGDIKEQRIEDVIRFFELGSHTGKLMVRSAIGTGNLEVSKGRVLRAEFSPLKGEDAVYALIALQEGIFSFESLDQVDEEQVEIELENYALILEGRKRIAEIGVDALLLPVKETQEPDQSGAPLTLFVPKNEIEDAAQETAPAADDNQTDSEPPVEEDSQEAVDQNPDAKEVDKEQENGIDSPTSSPQNAPHAFFEQTDNSESLLWWDEETISTLAELFADDNRNPLPLRWMTWDNVSGLKDRFKGTSFLSLYGNDEFIKNAILAISGESAPEPWSPDTLPVMRLAVSRQKILYILGIPESMGNFLPQGHPLVVWGDTPSLDDSLENCHEKQCWGIVMLTADPAEPQQHQDKWGGRLKIASTGLTTDEKPWAALREIFALLLEIRREQ